MGHRSDPPANGGFLCLLKPGRLISVLHRPRPPPGDETVLALSASTSVLFFVPVARTRDRRLRSRRQRGPTVERSSRRPPGSAAGHRRERGRSRGFPRQTAAKPSPARQPSTRCRLPLAGLARVFAVSTRTFIPPFTSSRAVWITPRVIQTAMSRLSVWTRSS
jgi:hypothetical protein